MPLPQSATSSPPTASRPLKPSQRTYTWQRKLKYLYYRFIRLQGSPHAIARGVAVGVFAGWFPLFGLQTIIGITLAAVLRGNKIAAAAATWVSNPFTYVPIYTFNFQIGCWILGSKTLANLGNLTTWDEFMALSGEVAIALFLGCTVVGIISAVIGYGLSLQVVSYLRDRRIQRKLAKTIYHKNDLTP